MQGLLSRLITLLIICITIHALPAFSAVVDVNQDKSRVRYALTKFGIPFKVKDLPTSGQIFLQENPNQSENQFKTYSLKGFYIKSYFTSKLTMFRELIEYDKYPYFFFSTDLKDPILLEDSKEINIDGYIIFKGIPKKVNINVTCRIKDNSLSLYGAIDIKMTDFGIEPPRFFFIRIDDSIKTKIDLYT